MEKINQDSISETDIFYKLLLLRQPGVGPVKYEKLKKDFGNVKNAVDSACFSDEYIDSVKREMDDAHKIGVKYISDENTLYPKNLAQIPNHPPVISVRGNINVLSKPVIGMVGTRHATAAGMRFIYELAQKFSEHGYAVASGMAIGTDTAAHKGALAASGDSQTIAVLAGGVDYIWPIENERLYHYILERGVVISEMPLGVKSVATNFIQRNRWIAGLSEKLILGEADLKSGSMATAGFATGYKVPIFAIPGHPSDARSMGPNRLIQSGDAKIITAIDDFFDSESKKEEKISHNDNDENDLLDKLGNIPMSESVLAGLVKKNITELKRELVMLELKGLVQRTDNGYVKI